MAYPSRAQRARLEGFPDRITVEDVRACFALSEADRALVFDQRGPENRLGLAVSLCAVRFLGFVPQDIASIPEDALRFLADQVDAAPHELLAYGTRAQTRSDHLQLVLAHEGWHRPGGEEHASLAAWLGERVVEHDAPATLVALTTEHLRARRVLRPPVETLLRMIGAARGDAHRHVEAIFGDQLTAARRAELDGLAREGHQPRPDKAGIFVSCLCLPAAATARRALPSPARRAPTQGTPKVVSCAAPTTRERWPRSTASRSRLGGRRRPDAVLRCASAVPGLWRRSPNERQPLAAASRSRRPLRRPLSLLARRESGPDPRCCFPCQGARRRGVGLRPSASGRKAR